MSHLLVAVFFAAISPAFAGELEQLREGSAVFPEMTLGQDGPARPRAPRLVQYSSEDRTPPPLIQPGKPAATVVGLPEGAQPVATINLEDLYNRLWRTSLTVEFGGETFYVSGMASHENDYFVVVHNPQGKTYFLRDMNLALTGQNVALGAADVHVQVYPNVMDIWGSELVLKQKGGARFAFPTRDIMRAMYEAGEPVTLDGRAFRVHYNDQIYENESGRIARTGEPLLVFMAEQAAGSYTSEKFKYIGDAIEGDSIPADGNALLGWLKVPPYGLMSYVFRKSADGKTLEIYRAR